MVTLVAWMRRDSGLPPACNSGILADTTRTVASGVPPARDAHRGNYDSMIAECHQKLADSIWAIANKLRGSYRPPQYRRVMLPLIVLRRLDCVLEPTKDAVLKQHEALKAKGLSNAAIEKALARVASKERKQPLYTVSPYTFAKPIGDPNGLLLAKLLVV